MYVYIRIPPSTTCSRPHDLTQLILISTCSSAPLIIQHPLLPVSSPLFTPPILSSFHQLHTAAVLQLSTRCPRTAPAVLHTWASPAPLILISLSLHTAVPPLSPAGSSAYCAFLFYSLKPETCLKILAAILDLVIVSRWKSLLVLVI